jgi:superfamily I DNA/RNA helicase
MTPEQAQENNPWVLPDELAELGATQLLIDGVRAGKWRQWIEGAQTYSSAVEQWGQEAVDHPKVRIGTIHSAKGSEADNVAVLTSIPSPCFRAAQTPEGFDEETRCKYVAVTRAKRRLVILNESKTKFRWRLDV